jgi:hypothetical protein
MRFGLVLGVVSLLLAVPSVSARAAPSSSAGAEDSLPSFDPSGLKVAARVALDGAISHLATVDLNGDGHPDVLLTVQKDTGVHPVAVIVLVNNGRGGFSDQTQSVFTGPVPRPEAPTGIVVADFNGDGRPDVFLPDGGNDAPPFTGYQNTLVLSAPGGHLVDASTNLPPVSDNSGSACAADVDHDGHVDLYVGNLYSAGLTPPRLLLNDGSGHFAVGGSLPPELSSLSDARYSSCAFVDVNGDGSPDLVLGADDHTANSAVLLNDGASNFHYLADALPPKPLGPTTLGLAIASCDVNHDGHPDLLIAYDTTMQVLVGNGDGTFHDETATRLPPAQNNGTSSIYGIEVMDLDNNGTPDFGTHLGFANNLPAFYTSNAAGVFHAVDLPVATTNWKLTDLNGDGRVDIVEAAPLGGQVDVNLQKPPTKATPKCKRGQRSTRRHPCHR